MNIAITRTRFDKNIDFLARSLQILGVKKKHYLIFKISHAFNPRLKLTCNLLGMKNIIKYFLFYQQYCKNKPISMQSAKPQIH